MCEKREGGCVGAHWMLSTPKALTLEAPLILCMIVSTSESAFI